MICFHREAGVIRSEVPALDDPDSEVLDELDSVVERLLVDVDTVEAEPDEGSPSAPVDSTELAGPSGQAVVR